MWPFKRKPAPPADCRVWNEDWRVGDIAECVKPFDAFHPDMVPWERPQLGQRFVVKGFSDGVGERTGKRAYFLLLEGWPVALECTAFRKVRPVAAEKSEIIERILTAKPGADRKREEA